jgi:hypothetical protein
VPRQPSAGLSYQPYPEPAYSGGWAPQYSPYY